MAFGEIDDKNKSKEKEDSEESSTENKFQEVDCSTEKLIDSDGKSYTVTIKNCYGNMAVKIVNVNSM